MNEHTCKTCIDWFDRICHKSGEFVKEEQPSCEDYDPISENEYFVEMYYKEDQRIML